MAYSGKSKKNARSKIIPYGRQSINNHDIKAVEKVLRSPFLTQGPAVEAFEQALKKQTGASYAVAVTNGTAALHSAYLAYGIGPGDEVIVPANTFAATANMVLAVGAKPIFCDIRLDTYNIDETKIEKLITKKTRAIVPVHYAGHPCEMDNILKIARRHKLLVIEDACHAIGARYRGKPVGSLGTAAATFSFHPVKVITTGEGGMIVTDSKDVYEKMKLIRSHGIVKGSDGWNSMIMMGWNYRMTDIQAGLGLSQLKKLDKFIKQRKEIVAKYESGLKNVSGIILPKELSNVSSAWHLYPLRLVPHFAPHFEKIVEELKIAGIGIQRHYPPVYAHPFYRKLGYKKGLCPNAELFYATELSLPLFPSLTQTDQNYVISVVKKTLENFS